EIGARAELHLSQERLHRPRHRRKRARARHMEPPRVEELVDHLERLSAGGAELARAEEEAGAETEEIEAERRDHRVVEVVEIEDLATAVDALAAGGDEGAEVLEVSVADDPALARRPLRELRLGAEDVVEHRRRAAQERERRGPHAGDLPVEGGRKATG